MHSVPGDPCGPCPIPLDAGGFDDGVPGLVQGERSDALASTRYRSAVSRVHLIRALVAEDQLFLWTVLYHAIYVPPGEPPPPRDIVRSPELARYAAGWMSRPGDQGALAEAGGEPVGAVWLRFWTPGDHGYGYVDPSVPELSMAMLPEHRGRGTGTELLRAALRGASQSASSVSLSVTKTNRALRLYERLGFEPVCESEDNSLTMIKRL